MPAASVHIRHRLILVYQPPSFAPVKPPAAATVARFPLKNSLFILSGNREFAMRSIVVSLPHAPLIIPIMDHNSHCVLYLSVRGGLGACVWQLFVWRYLQSPLRKFSKLILPSCRTFYFLLPHLFARSPDSCSFNVTSQDCVPGRDPQLKRKQTELGSLSVVLVWLIWVLWVEAEEKLEQKVTDGNLKFKHAMKVCCLVWRFKSKRLSLR